MSKITEEAFMHIASLVWDSDGGRTAESILESIQGIVYQAEQNMDAQTEREFGDDDQYPYPNMRRC